MKNMMMKNMMNMQVFPSSDPNVCKNCNCDTPSLICNKHKCCPPRRQKQPGLRGVQLVSRRPPKNKMQ